VEVPADVLEDVVRHGLTILSVPRALRLSRNRKVLLSANGTRVLARVLSMTAGRRDDEVVVMLEAKDQPMMEG